MAGIDSGHAMAESDAAAGGLERKLATILSADVAAYSRLMAEDEERTLQTFCAHKEVFEKLVELHRGRVFNTAGDAILAEFSSPVEAVRCATEIQAALRTRNDQLASERQVNFRIGVNLGDVMVQGADLLGDGVNVAARLQGAAEPGGARMWPARIGVPPERALRARGSEALPACPLCRCAPPEPPAAARDRFPYRASHGRGYRS